MPTGVSGSGSGPRLKAFAPVRRQHHPLLDLRPVVILGRHPEDGDRRLAGGFEGGGPAGGGQRLGEAVERTAEEPRLLAGHHDAHGRIGQQLRQAVSVRVAVGAVAHRQGLGQFAAVHLRRRKRRQASRGEEVQRRQQIEIEPGEPRRGERRQQAGGGRGRPAVTAGQERK